MTPAKPFDSGLDETSNNWLAGFGGEEFYDRMTEQGVTGKHCPAITAMIMAVADALRGETDTAISSLNIAVRLLEIANDPAKAKQSRYQGRFKPLDRGIIEQALGHPIEPDE